MSNLSIGFATEISIKLSSYAPWNSCDKLSQKSAYLFLLLSSNVNPSLNVFDNGLFVTPFPEGAR